MLQHYPLPNAAGANNYIRTGVEPDNQDQFDGRVDHVFNEKHRAFVRYSYLRDDDNPVTFLPDGSGNLTSGVIGHAITRGDGIASEYDWTLSPTTLNQARFGYTRRDVNQTSLQNGGITVPGAPVSTFPSTLPIFTVTGLPADRAHHRRERELHHLRDRVSRHVLHGARTPHLQVRNRHSARSARHRQPGEPDRLLCLHHHRHRTPPPAPGGNALASLLLGQVNAFSIDIQNQALQAARSHRGVLRGRRLENLGPPHAESRHALHAELSLHGSQQSRRVFNLKTQVLDFPHTARELECCDFGPRVGLAYRRPAIRWVIRSGYGMVWFEQTGITTPFTLPQFPFVQTVGQQSQDNINPAFVLSNGPTVQVTPPNPNSGLGQGVFGVDRNVGSGYSQQWNFTVQKTFGSDLNFEIGYLGSKNTHLGLPESNLNQLPAADLALGSALTAKVPNPYLRTDSRLLFARAADHRATAVAARLPALHQRRAVPRQRGRFRIRSASGQAGKALLARPDLHLRLHVLEADRRRLHLLLPNHLYRPTLTTIGAADAFNRKLERDVSSGDIPRVFSAGWVYQIPRWWKISGWQIGGLVRVQAGDAVPVTQATNNLSAFGYAVQRPNRVGNPNDFATRSASAWFDKAGFTAAGQFVIGNSSRNPVRGPGLQNADVMIGKTFRVSERDELRVPRRGLQCQQHAAAERSERLLRQRRLRDHHQRRKSQGLRVRGEDEVLMKQFAILLAAGVLAPGLSGQTAKREVTVAAAANLSEVFRIIGPQFEAATGIHPVFSFASTAQLSLQIENSAPYDVFAAADVEHVVQLENKGLLLRGSRAIYATGILALWIPPGSPANVNEPADLVRSSVKVIALAKPELAPYGLAARESLQRLGIWDRIQPKVVYADSIGMAKQYGASGNADAVFSAYSLVLKEKGKVIQLKEELHAPVEQALGIVAATKNREAAQKFVGFLLTGAGRQTLGRSGYRTPALRQ